VFTQRAQSSGAGRAWRSTTPAGTAILIVEGDESCASILAAYLTQEGFEVRVALDGAEGLAVFESHPSDLVLIDLALTELTGLDLCRRIRSTSDVPIIMMSAKGSEVDAVLALELGADDYVNLGCRLRELVARVRAALRRAPAAEAEDPRGILKVGAVTLDRVRCEVTVDGERRNLPRKEFRLLELLMEHPGRVFSRRMLMSRVWGEDYVGTTKTLDVHVRRLRGKVEVDAATPRRIVTVRGLGFKFEPPMRAVVTPIHPDARRSTGTDDTGSNPPVLDPYHQAFMGGAHLGVVPDDRAGEGPTAGPDGAGPPASTGGMVGKLAHVSSSSSKSQAARNR